MTTVSRFSRQNDTGLRALNVFLCVNRVLVVVLVLESEALYSFVRSFSTRIPPMRLGFGVGQVCWFFILLWEIFFFGFSVLTKNVCLNCGLKAFIYSARVKSAKLKDEFCSRLLWLSVFPWCGERPQIVMLWVEWFGRLKWRLRFLFKMEIKSISTCLISNSSVSLSSRRRIAISGENNLSLVRI